MSDRTANVSVRKSAGNQHTGRDSADLRSLIHQEKAETETGIKHQQKTCSKCARTQPRAEFRVGRATCRECNNRYWRAYRRTHKGYNRARAQRPEYRAAVRAGAARWDAANPQAVKARKKVQAEIKAGRLKREPCEFCGATKVHGHHRDYSRPLDVRWLCPQHHRQVHNLTPKALGGLGKMG